MPPAYHPTLGEFRLGLRKDDKRHHRDNFRKMRGLFGAKPSGFASLAQYLPEVMDQGKGYEGTSSCVGQGLAGAIYATLAARGKRLPWVPSPRRIYTPSRCLDRAHDFPSMSVFQLPTLADQGTFVVSGVKAVSEWGVVPMDTSTPGFEHLRSDVTPGNVNVEPNLLELEQMATKLIIGAVELNVWDVDSIEAEVQLALDAGYTVVSGAFVGSPWQHYDLSSPPLGAQDFGDEGGGHCTFLYGYVTDPSTGQTTYEGQNSWGVGWGHAGRFQCTGAAVRQWWEAYILKVEVA